MNTIVERTFRTITLVGKHYVNTVKFLTLFGYLSFFLVSYYMLFTGKSFEYYPQFASLTAGSGIFGQLVNHYFDSKFNSPSGTMPNDQ